MDSIFTRIAICCLLTFLGFQAFKELKKPEKETYIEQHEPQMLAEGTLAEGEHMTDKDIPSTKIKNPVKLLTFFLVLATGVGFVMVSWVVPLLGDLISGATFSSGEKAGPSPYARAISLTTTGQYVEAVIEFQRLAAADPTDRYPVMELVKLQLGKLENVDAAILTLQNALAQEWPEKDGAFFSQRLADLYQDEKGESARAKEILHSIIAKYPASPAAGNATHRIREIEEAEFIASRKQS
jgi:TolA-binding protein